MDFIVKWTYHGHTMPRLLNTLTNYKFRSIERWMIVLIQRMATTLYLPPP